MDISYDGTSFHGWQRQKNALSVQEVLEEALSTVLKSETEIVGSGRTDTGVHARQQIAHFDSSKEDLEKLEFRLNSFLNSEISINKIIPVKPEAHARFDAEKRTYYYHINTVKNPFQVNFSHYLRKTIDLELIQQACVKIMNHQDFECFSRVKTEVNNFNCDVTRCEFQVNDSGYLFVISANRFLRGMVRAIVGTLLEVGMNKLSIEKFDSILEGRDRTEAGPSVPAKGLFLQEVLYPDSIYL